MAMRTTKQHSRWRLTALLTGAIVAAFAASGVTATAQSQAPTLEAAISSWEAGHTGKPVPLIVQHEGDSAGLLDYVRAAGGSVDREFHIVPAVEVSVPAGEVDALAARSDVHWISLDAPVQSTSNPGGNTDAIPAVIRRITSGGNVYPTSVNAPAAWLNNTGSGITVALIDTGVSYDARYDFKSATDWRVKWVATNALDATKDGFGHGTHVAGIIGGRSTTTIPAGRYTGIAPGSTIMAIRVADDNGNATVGDLMAGLEYVDDHRATDNIKILNLSVTSTLAESYKIDPIDAAVELLWFHGVAVVVAAGNDGTATDAVSYPPANDPFVITTGAFDDKGTLSLIDDGIADWSSRGRTQDNVAKPDLLAPGTNIISPMSASSYLATTYPQAIVETKGNVVYFQMSGTSMATGAMSGVVALVRKAHPTWTPGQLKYALSMTARAISAAGSTKGVLADKAIGYTGALKSSDDGIAPNYILLAAAGVGNVDFSGLRWRDAVFNGLLWRGLELNGIRWRTVDWSGLSWGSANWSGVRWNGLDLEGIRWRGIRWRAVTE